ncbi:hypothetical protein M569_08180 [Genlisea aurea]|uniref:Uncharacterized protein n=1 Tax=Genlisea aurea TaxID=192259 RepID=S8CP41_9LAMI|nr:hypothetical protein M569_08180 [Genlisea aurea]
MPRAVIATRVIYERRWSVARCISRRFWLVRCGFYCSVSAFLHLICDDLRASDFCNYLFVAAISIGFFAALFYLLPCLFLYVVFSLALLPGLRGSDLL